jgi:hypothetical protein
MIGRRDIGSSVHRRYSHSWCTRISQSAERWICPFREGIWHSNGFSLVSRRRCQISHQQYHTSLSACRFREESSVEPVFYAIWGRIFTATNLTGLKPLPSFSVRAFEGQVFQINTHKFPELETAIQWETAAIFRETLTNDNCVLLLPKGRDFGDIVRNMFKCNKEFPKRVEWSSFIQVRPITKKLQAF